MNAQTLYAIVYLEINVMSALLVSFIRFKTLGISQMVSQRNFSLAIDAEIVFFLSDTAAVLISNVLIPYSAFGMMAAKTVYFFSTALMCFFWFIYFEHLQGSSFVRCRRAVLLSSCLVWVMGLLLIVNLFTGILFYVDDGGYHRGPLFAIQYLLSYLYVFAASSHALIGCFQKQKLSQKKLLVSLALFPLAPAGAGVIQFVYPELPVACFALSFATLILYQNWLDDMISIDPLTHLNNRKQLIYHYEQWRRHSDSIPLYLLLIDANKFKSINDIYGHIQGDAALERIADALRLACKELRYRANIARYGGDEFVILARSPDEKTIEGLRSKINHYLDKLNREAAAPYELSVSVGITRAKRNKTMKTLISEADEKLYAEKARRR